MTPSSQPRDSQLKFSTIQIRSLFVSISRHCLGSTSTSHLKAGDCGLMVSVKLVSLYNMLRDDSFETVK